MGATFCDTGRFAASEQSAVLMPRWWNPNGTKRCIIYCHALGQLTPSAMATTGTLPLLQYLSDFTLVVIADLGGAGPCGNATAQARLDTAFSVAVSTYGAKADKFCWIGESMGGWLGLNYTNANTSKVAAGVGLIPGTDMASVRNGNLPNGWSGTSQNSPANCSTINAAWGLGANSTGDYPLHGTSLEALPAGANPAASSPPGVPLKAWYAADDTTMLASTVTAYWPQTASIPNPAGHSETSVGNVPKGDVLTFLAPYL